MNSISTSEKSSSWEKIKQAIVDSSEKESKKPLEEKLKEEALLPLYLYKGAVKGSLKMLESGVVLNGLRDSIQDLHQITTDRKGFEEEKKRQRETIIQFGKETVQHPTKKFYALLDGTRESITQKTVEFIQAPRLKQGEMVGELAPDLALTAIGMEEFTATKRVKEISSLWSSTKKLSSAENAYKHFLKHQNEFEKLESLTEYIAKAKNFAKNTPENTLVKIKKSGDKVFYHPPSNTMAIQEQSGKIRTLFKPDPLKHGYPTNMDYFNAQH